jgi:hypothetical protein
MLDIRVILAKFTPEKAHMGDTKFIGSLKANSTNNFVNRRVLIAGKDTC